MELALLGVDAVLRERRVAVGVLGAEHVVDASDVIEAELLGEDRIVANDTWVGADQLLAQVESNLHARTLLLNPQSSYGNKRGSPTVDGSDPWSLNALGVDGDRYRRPGRHPRGNNSDVISWGDATYSSTEWR